MPNEFATKRPEIMKSTQDWSTFRINGRQALIEQWFQDRAVNAFRRMWVLVIVACIAATTADAQVCPFDDGNSSLAVEGLILTRYALGVTGAPLVMSTGIDAVDAPSVEAAINCPSCGLNITGNPTMTVADATIISRKLAGFSGDALTANLNLGTGTRNTNALVQSFLLGGCGATGGTVTSITAGTGLTGGVIATTGTIAADTTYLQRRVSGSCALPGSYIIGISADGTVTCSTPPTGGPGTVTQVQTGPGLTGGPITGAGTVNLASTQLLPTTACSTDQIAKWSGSAWICAAAPPAFPICIIGQVMRVGVSGGLQCGNLPHTIFTNAEAGVSFTYTSIAVGSDGRPVVAYRTSATSTLRLLKCGDASCSGGNVDTEIDSSPGTGYFASAAVAADNRPIIAYYHVNNADLMVTKCGNTECSSGNVTTLVDGVGESVGAYTSIAIPADGRPVISYRDFANTALKVVKCGNAACSNGNAFSTLDTNAAEFTSIAIGADGFPVVAYFDAINTALKVARCADAACAASATVTLDDTSANTGQYASIAVPADGRPVVSYHDQSNSRLRYARCGNAGCTTGNVRSTLDDSVSSVGQYASIALGSDGLPVVSYRDSLNADLKVIKCGSLTCASASRITTTVDRADNVGAFSSLAMPADGLPVIAYQDITNNAFKVLKCSNAACANP